MNISAIRLVFVETNIGFIVMCKIPYSAKWWWGKPWRIGNIKKLAGKLWRIAMSYSSLVAMRYAKFK